MHAVMRLTDRLEHAIIKDIDQAALAAKPKVNGQDDDSEDNTMQKYCDLVHSIVGVKYKVNTVEKNGEKVREKTDLPAYQKRKLLQQLPLRYVSLISCSLLFYTNFFCFVLTHVAGLRRPTFFPPRQ
jgi:hypothetical protein